MNIIRSTGAFGRSMAWIGGLGLLSGAVAYVPSPLGVIDFFRTVPVQEAKSLPVLKLATMPEIERFADITQRPLFNPERLPDPVVNSPSSAGPDLEGPVLGDLAQFRLVGIAGDSQTKVALIQKVGGNLMTVKPGDSLEGWTVTAIEARGVSISGGGRKEILTIPRAANSAKSP